MIDNLQKESSPSKSEISLIVKENFYIGLNSVSEFIFIPTGSKLKYVKHTSSVMPYYELESYNIYLEHEGNEFSFKGSRTIRTKESLKLSNCSTKLINNKIEYGVTRWDEVFVQRFDSIIKV